MVGTYTYIKSIAARSSLVSHQNSLTKKKEETQGLSFEHSTTEAKRIMNFNALFLAWNFSLLWTLTISKPLPSSTVGHVSVRGFNVAGEAAAAVFDRFGEPLEAQISDWERTPCAFAPQNWGILS